MMTYKKNKCMFIIIYDGMPIKKRNQTLSRKSSLKNGFPKCPSKSNSLSIDDTQKISIVYPNSTTFFRVLLFTLCYGYDMFSTL